mmetsp:Transcript_6859/g.22778  ORF Transcript_6859/g.22778 Transcript_6859/m.22778 type:complete len:326 (-) Transcript_6859:422-1399(-)
MAKARDGGTQLRHEALREHRSAAGTTEHRRVHAPAHAAPVPHASAEKDAVLRRDVASRVILDHEIIERRSRRRNKLPLLRLRRLLELNPAFLLLLLLLVVVVVERRREPLEPLPRKDSTHGRGAHHVPRPLELCAHARGGRRRLWLRRRLLLLLHANEARSIGVRGRRDAGTTLGAASASPPNGDVRQRQGRHLPLVLPLFALLLLPLLLLLLLKRLRLRELLLIILLLGRRVGVGAHGGEAHVSLHGKHVLPTPVTRARLRPVAFPSAGVQRAQKALAEVDPARLLHVNHREAHLCRLQPRLQARLDAAAAVAAPLGGRLRPAD